MSILIVDSDQADQNEQEAILKKAGYAYVTVANSMQAAIECLGLENSLSSGQMQMGIDLVVAGLATTEDCAEFCRKIKDSFQYQDIPILVTTSASPSEAFPLVVANGAYDFIRKPFSEIEYLARVRSAIRLKHETDRRKARERELIEATRQLSDLNTMLVRLSLIDSMTGVANRRHFDRVLDKEWRRAVRSQLPISLVMIDVDHFKDYNDNYGHQEGDECLKQISAILKHSLKRPADSLCRYGGEEFVIVLPETPNYGALLVAEFIRKAIQDAAIPHRFSKVCEYVTISVGVATIEASSKVDPKELVELADKALYRAKSSGRNQVATINEEIGLGAA